MNKPNIFLKTNDLNVLKKNFFFKDMESHEVDKFLKIYKWNIKTYDKGEINFDENIFLKNLNIVLDGVVKISKITKTGKEIVYDILESGRIFGVASIYTNIPMEGLQIEALKKNSIFYIDNKEIKKIIYENSLFFSKFMEFQEYKFHFFIKRFENSFILCPYEKLFSFFNSLKKENIYEINMQKVQLANYLNIGRASLYRELDKMKEKKLIDISGNKIYIK